MDVSATGFGKEIAIKIIIVVVIAVLLYFMVLRPILVKLGIVKTSDQVKQEQQSQTFATSTESPFSPRYWKSVDKPVILTKAAATSLASQINNAIGYLYDDENAVYAALRQLKYKTQLSYLADIISQTYQEDLFSLLSRNLNKDEMAIVNGIANGLS